MELILIFWILPMVIGAALDKFRGFLLAFLFSWLGVLLAAVLGSMRQRKKQHAELMEMLGRNQAVELELRREQERRYG